MQMMAERGLEHGVTPGLGWIRGEIAPMDPRGEDGAPLITSEQAVSVATRMAAELTRVCSAFTVAGTIWEVDSALRPEGKAGQLVRTLSSHRTYYERWAKTW